MTLRAWNRGVLRYSQLPCVIRQAKGLQSWGIRVCPFTLVMDQLGEVNAGSLRAEDGQHPENTSKKCLTCVSHFLPFKICQRRGGFVRRAGSRRTSKCTAHEKACQERNHSDWRSKKNSHGGGDNDGVECFHQSSLTSCVALSIPAASKRVRMPTSLIPEACKILLTNLGCATAVVGAVSNAAVITASALLNTHLCFI